MIADEITRWEDEQVLKKLTASSPNTIWQVQQRKRKGQKTSLQIFRGDTPSDALRTRLEKLMLRLEDVSKLEDVPRNRVLA